jgi:hypothetical protein
MAETTRRRGRPQGVKSTHVMIRIPNDLLAQIDAYAESLQAQIGISDVSVSRAMAIRELCKKGLQSLASVHQPAAQPAPASHRNGQGAPAPQPTTQPAIPLALEPAPKTAEPVDVLQVSEAPTESQNGEADIPSYDTDKYVLGKLCKHGHDYHGTGQSLRQRGGKHDCRECKNVSSRACKERQRQAKR